MLLCRNGLVLLLFSFLLACSSQSTIIKEPVIKQLSPELNTQLLEAAKKGNFKQFKILLQKGANINSKDAEGFSLIHIAAFNGSYDIVHY